MAQESQQFTPAQILEAGRRAEMEGRLDYAVQFYRHLTGHMPRTIEASAAEQALLRLGVSTGSPASQGASGATGPATGTTNGYYQNGAGPANGTNAGMILPNKTAPQPARQGNGTRAVAPAEGPAIARRKLLLPRLRRRYRTGRFIARALTFLGFLEIGVGSLGLVVAALTQGNVTIPGLPSMLASQSPITSGVGGIALMVLGALLVLGGQLARAVFDQASANRDLAALWRAQSTFNHSGKETGTSGH